MSENHDKGGRPELKVTRTMRRRVAIAAGAGMSHEEIAIGLGIARNTLEKHFEAELSVGAYKRRMDVLEAMHDAALKGNVTAARAYLDNTPRAAAPPPPPPAPDPELPKKGKKEQAADDAKTAAVGTDWNELIGPRATRQ